VSPIGAFVALACNDGRLRVMTCGEQLCRTYVHAPLNQEFEPQTGANEGSHADACMRGAQHTVLHSKHALTAPAAGDATNLRGVDFKTRP
jgi:hypothetical protein